MKEQEKSSGKKKLSKMEESKLPDTEFKTMVMRMLRVLSDNFNNIKKDMEP